MTSLESSNARNRQPRRGIENDWVVLIVGILVAYALVDSLYVGIPVFQRALFGLLLLGTMVAAAATAARVRLGSREMTYLVAMFAVLIGGSVGILTQSILYPFYILGDLASIGLLGLFLIFGLATSKSLFSGKAIVVLWGACLIGSILSPLIGVENGRFDPPSPFLIGVTVGFAIAAPRRSGTFAAVCVLFIIVLLAYKSGFRTHVALAMVGAFVALGRLMGPRIWLSGLVVLCAIAVVNAPSIGRYLASQAVVSESRFQDLSTGEADQSVLERSLEVKDAWVSARDGWSKYQWFVGAGHGATYIPVESNIIRNIMRENRVHNIHVGPMLVLYRYGFLGIAALMLLVVVTVRQSWSQFFQKHGTTSVVNVFPWVLLFYLADFLVRNVMIDPFFAYAVAGLAAGHRGNARIGSRQGKYEIDRLSRHVASGST